MSRIRSITRKLQPVLRRNIRNINPSTVGTMERNINPSTVMERNINPSTVGTMERNILPKTNRRNFQTSSLSSQEAKKDFYETLGVSPEATNTEIKNAYFQLALKFHPDTNKDDPDAAKKFISIAEAYEVLSNEKQKLFYDTSRRSENWNDFCERYGITKYLGLDLLLEDAILLFNYYSTEEKIAAYKRKMEQIIDKMKDLSTNPIFETKEEGGRSTNTNQQRTPSDQDIEIYKREFIQPYFEDFMNDTKITTDQLYNVSKDISDKNKKYIKDDTKEIIKEIVNYYKPYNLKKIYTELLDYSEKSELDWSDITIIRNIFDTFEKGPTDLLNNITRNVLNKLEPFNILITGSDIMEEISNTVFRRLNSLESLRINQRRINELLRNSDMLKNNYPPSKKTQIIRIIYQDIKVDERFLENINSLLQGNILKNLKTYLSKQLNKQSFNNSNNTDNININTTVNLINRIETMFEIQQSKRNEIINKQKEKEVLVEWIEGFKRSRTNLKNNESNVIQKSLEKLKTSDAQNSDFFKTVYNNFYDSNISNEEKVKSLKIFVNNN